MTAALASRQRILDAALKEFADNGFSGARMDAIARAAAVNKALPFYYYSSKEKLYGEVVSRVMQQFLGIIRPVMNAGLTPEVMIERFPRAIIEFFSSHRDFLRIVGRELLDGTSRVPELLARQVRGEPHGGPVFFGRMVEQWYRDGLIRESNPVHFMLNMFSLTIYSILARPMVEAVFQIQGKSDAEFYQERIRSVVTVLKEGLLK